MEVYTSCANVANEGVSSSSRNTYTLVATGNIKGDTSAVLAIPDPTNRKRSYQDANNTSSTRSLSNQFSHAALIALPPRQKIPRPPNAFMLFANEWRKKLAIQFPRESNKDISVRLGGMWKNMGKEEKDGYFGLARKVDAEHKKKYPDYVYNPKEARMRKALREQTRENRNQLSRAHSQSGMVGTGRASQSHNQQWMKGTQGFAGRSGRHPGLMSPKMMGDEMRMKFREQVEQGVIQGFTETLMDVETIPYSQMGLPGSGDYAIMSDMDGQWYPFGQSAQHGASPYMMRHGDEKMQPGSPWNIHYATDNRGPQAPAYMMRHQMMGPAGNYGASVPPQGVQPAPMNQAAQRPNTVQQQPSYANLYQQQTTANNQQAANMIPKREVVNREERMRMLDLMPTTSSNQITPNTTPQKTLTSSSFTAATNTTQSTTTSATTQSSASKTSTAGTEATAESATGDSSAENGNANRPLPAFEQAFGSTEIGRYSHEGFFSNNQQAPATNNPGTQVSQTNPPEWNGFANHQLSPSPILNPMYDGGYSFNTQYSYYNYVNEFAYSYRDYSHMNWSSGIKYDDALNGY